MLVITRKQSELIKVGNDVVIKVIRTGRGSVKIGIDAPAHVRVLRGELCEFETEEASESRVKGEEAEELPFRPVIAVANSHRSLVC